MSRVLGLPAKMKEFGLNVKLVSGWETRGDSYFYPQGVVCHHTASNRNSGNTPALGICVNGRSDLPGPLCNVLLARNGDCYMVASGRANHAGSGSYRGLSGNSTVLGIEAENDGIGEPWSSAQLDAYYRLVAAMCSLIGRDSSWVCGHKEWTTRKIDPTGIDMNSFRSHVQDVLSGNSGGLFVTEQDKKDLDSALNAHSFKTVIAIKQSELNIMKLIRRKFATNKKAQDEMQLDIDALELEIKELQDKH